MSTQKSTLPIHISPFSFTFVHTIRCLSLDGFTVHIWNDKENRKKKIEEGKKDRRKGRKEGVNQEKNTTMFYICTIKAKVVTKERER